MYSKDDIKFYINLFYKKFKKKPNLKHSPFTYNDIKKYFKSWDNAYIDSIN